MQQNHNDAVEAANSQVTQHSDEATTAGTLMCKNYKIERQHAIYTVTDKRKAVDLFINDCD